MSFSIEKYKREGFLRGFLLMITIAGVIATDVSNCITPGINGLALFVHIFNLILSFILLVTLVIGLKLISKMMILQLSLTVLDAISFILFIVAGILQLTVLYKEKCTSGDEAKIAAGILSLMGSGVTLVLTFSGLWDFRNMCLEDSSSA